MTAITVQKAHTFLGHRDCIYTLEFAEDRNTFFSGSGDGMVVSWSLSDPDKGQLVAQVPNSVYALNYNNGILAVGHNYEGLHFIDVAARSEIASYKFTEAAIFDIKNYDQFLFIATGDGELVVFDGKRNEIVQRFKHSDKSARCLAIHPDAWEVAVGYSDNYIRVFDLKNFALKKEWEAHQKSVFALSYSPDYRYLLSGSRDAHLKAWKTGQSYEQAQDIIAHMYAINHISYRADGRYFVTASMDKSVKVWDAEQFRLLKVIDKGRHAGHATSVNKLLWGNSDGTIISASDDRSISIWEVEGLSDLAALEGF